MTHGDKNNYRGPDAVTLRKEIPKPWELELSRNRQNVVDTPPPLPTPTPPPPPKDAGTSKIMAMAANAGLKISFTSRMDA